MNTDGTGQGQGPFVLQASTPVAFVWCATARDKESLTNDPTASSVRENDTVYMRGLKERISVITNSQDCWRWRRIVISSKAVPFRGTGGAGTDIVAIENINGWQRVLRNSVGTAYLGTIETSIFKGSASVDWASPFTAKLDTRRVTVRHDSTITIRSGNATGVYRDIKRWYPINKNLVYSNDEQGERESPDIFSTTGLDGCGDVYIIDYIQCVTSTLSTNTLNFSPQATLYWHER